MFVGEPDLRLRFSVHAPSIIQPRKLAVPHPWLDRRVTLMGLGRHGGGVGAARWLAEQGARLTITDLADEVSLADSLQAIHDLPIERLRLGQHVEDDFTEADAVIVNPAVRPGNHFVELARRRGAEILTEIELFLNACPARVIGVTGSNGKSTTAALLAAMLQADGRRVWLGGNFGGSLLGQLTKMTTADWVVLELSSFQLFYLSDEARWPGVAVITNCSPNHLDWHGTYEHYVASKRRLVTNLTSGGIAVLNPWDAEVRGWASPGNVVPKLDLPTPRLPTLRLPGFHNQVNAACAQAAALAVGCSQRGIGQALAEFCGLPHRLELVAEIAGRQFYNDSKATTPEATIAALATFDAPVWLLAGGHDKGGDHASLARQIAARARGAAFFGRARSMFHDLLRQQTSGISISTWETMQQALSWCWRQSAAGDVILLSPACASFDQFQDFARRGNTFVALVHEIAARNRDGV